MEIGTPRAVLRAEPSVHNRRAPAGEVSERRLRFWKKRRRCFPGGTGHFLLIGRSQLVPPRARGFAERRASSDGGPVRLRRTSRTCSAFGTDQFLSAGKKIPAGNEKRIPAGDGDPFSLEEEKIPGSLRADWDWT